MRRPWLIVLGLTKIDWLELQRSIEGIRARSARRRAWLSQSERQGGKRALLGLLQLRHSRRRIWEAGHRPCRVNDDCFPRVISHDDPPIPGRDLKCAVWGVFVAYGAIIQEGIGPARSLDFAYGGERQCGKRQDADPAILRGASDPCERGIDPEATGLRYLAGNESEDTFAETKQGRIRGPVANEFVQRHAGVIRIACGAIGEGDADRAIGRRLDRVDCLERRSPRYMGVAATSAIITWRIAGATKHETPPCAAGCLAMGRFTVFSRHAHACHPMPPLALPPSTPSRSELQPPPWTSPPRSQIHWQIRSAISCHVTFISARTQTSY